jgi:Nucleolar protein,Nop52
MTAEDTLPETKRARRKLGAHPSQKWPQMPKVQGYLARAKAHLKVAGLSTKVSAPPLDPQLDLLNSPEVKFGRLLASPEQRIRHETVRRLNQYLTARCRVDKEGGGLSEIDLLKLWKGLWYTLYLADRVPVQDELSKHLVELIWCVAGTEEEDEYAAKTYLDMYGENDDEDEDDLIMDEIVDENDDEDPEGKRDDEEEENIDVDEDSVQGKEDNVGEDMDEENDNEDELNDKEMKHCRGAHLAALFVKTFFQTLRREWGGMDKYRVDKFYTLIRLMMEQIYEYMAKRHWNLGIIRLFNDTINDEVLSQIPNGLRLHVIDVSLDELAKVNSKASMPLTEATLIDVLEPFLALVQSCADKVVKGRAIEKILNRFLEKYSVISEDALEEAENVSTEESLIMKEAHVGTIADFIFSLGSDPDTSGDSRQSLYLLYKAYKKRLKEVGKDVVFDQIESADDVEAVRVIEVDDPLTFHEESESQNAGLSDSNQTKTKKKKKKKKGRNSEEVSNITKKVSSDCDDPAEQSDIENGDHRNSGNPVGENLGKEIKVGEKHIDASSQKDASNSVVDVSDSHTNPEANDDTLGKKSRKRKKKKRQLSEDLHGSVEDCVSDGENQSNENSNGESVSTKNAKKSKLMTASVKASDSTAANNLSVPKSTKRELRNHDSDLAVENVITISVEDQKKAMVSISKHKDSVTNVPDVLPNEIVKGKRKTAVETKEEKARRVRFGKFNHSKSHTASMKALLTMPKPNLIPVTPDKSILLNKSPKPKQISKSGARRKSSEYF